MSDKLLLLSLLDYTNILLKGGDFMAVESGPKQIPVEDPNPKNSSFPERRGRIRLTRFDTAIELVGIRVDRDQIKKDWSLAFSALEMDGVVADRRGMEDL